MKLEEGCKKLWEQGYGAIHHSKETIKRVEEMLQYFTHKGIEGDNVSPYRLLLAADKLANASMWLNVNQVYAKHIYLDGRDLASSDFKEDPQGHLGGSLNMVPAYVGYILINALTGITRSWVMAQGHAVAAIDSTNLLINNMTESHAQRYDLSEKGLTQYVQDFYSYKLGEDGRQDSPLGSHVNPHTAGGHLEGGYLGFASLLYPHMPIPGERLVAFLSDGDFEEQRGADWAARWWRAEDSGLIAPIMINNGRRIDQRTLIDQEGGVEFFKKHLLLYGFDPIVFDGRDPAAFAWSIFEQERRLTENPSALSSIDNYDIRIPYGIAVAPKGAGFYNEGSNYAHNLPLIDNPSNNEIAAKRFNTHIKKLFVPFDELKEASSLFQEHKNSNRVKEKDHPIANRKIDKINVPKFLFKDIEKHQRVKFSPMDAVDEGFLAWVKLNPNLRPRVGNPDEMLSNRMDDTLESLEFRVVAAEQGAEESTLGNVITALNEEAVVCAAFGNKGGINISVTYEAFASKMFGAARQEIIFSKHQKDIGKPAEWLSVPIVLTSNTWENSKNELSHQDPSMAESMLSETSDISRVIFPADFNSALETMKQVYQSRGQIWTLVVPKKKIPLQFSEDESRNLLRDGAVKLKSQGFNSEDASVAIIAIGAYQLIEAIKASERLTQKKVPHIVSYIAEPGKFRKPRDPGECENCVTEDTLKEIIPTRIKKAVLISHTRPEIIIGILNSLLKSVEISALGFINQGGTLGTDDMLFVNKSSWAHILESIEESLGAGFSILEEEEKSVLLGKKSPDGIITKIME